MTASRPRKLQVFVSSTYIDLKNERQAAVEAILAAGHIPAGMELFAAGDQSQMNVIRRWIDESDVFLLIVGDRYGSIEPRSGQSYVALEYQHAVKRRKPRFTLAIDRDVLRRRRAGRGRSGSGSMNARKQDAFWRKATAGTIVTMWKSPADIRDGTTRALREIESRSQIGGWTRAQLGGTAYWSNRDLPSFEEELADSKSVWAAWPVGTSILTRSNELLKKIRRVILCDPESATPEYTSLLEVDASSLAQDVVRITRRLQDVGADVRWFPRPPMGILISDPTEAHAWARTELLIPHRASFSRPGFRVEKPELATHVDDVLAVFERMWAGAVQPTLVTRGRALPSRNRRASGRRASAGGSRKTTAGAKQARRKDAAWRQIESRFDLITGEVDAIWSHYPATGVVRWTVHPRRGEGTQRDLQRFLSEAKRAAALLAADQHAPRKFNHRDVSASDQWLSCVAATADPANSMSGSGRDEDGAYESGFIDKVVEASRLTCARLAVGDQ